jgi:hypothetical protein
MSYGKTIQEFRAEYAPYDKMTAFDEGMRDYGHGNVSDNYNGVDAQAYDRGLECAMRIARLEQWERDNIGAD